MFYPKNPKRPNRQSANMAHYVEFCIGFQKNIPLQNPPGGGGGYMAAQGLLWQVLISAKFKMAANMAAIKTTMGKAFWFRYNVWEMKLKFLKSKSFCRKYSVLCREHFVHLLTTAF